MGKFCTSVWLTTCEVSVFSVSRTAIRRSRSRVLRRFDGQFDMIECLANLKIQALPNDSGKAVL